jgi:hypothetical protein
MQDDRRDEKDEWRWCKWDEKLMQGLDKRQVVDEDIGVYCEIVNRFILFYD